MRDDLWRMAGDPGFPLPGDEEFGLGLRFWASLRLGFPAALTRGRKVFLDQRAKSDQDIAMLHLDLGRSDALLDLPEQGVRILI